MEGFSYQKMMINNLEKLLNDWSLYYSDQSGDLNKEAVENCFTINFSGSDLASIDEKYMLKLISAAEKKFIGSANDAGKKMTFYSWVDEMIPALRFGIVSSTHNRLPFVTKLHEISDISLAAKTFVMMLNSSGGGISLSDLNFDNDDNEDKDLGLLNIYVKYS